MLCHNNPKKVPDRKEALRKLWAACDANQKNLASLSDKKAWELANEARKEVRAEAKLAKRPGLARSSF